MSATPLTTDFVKIGQSGPTVDGRTIDPAWLLQAAESYNTSTYTALIWPEHVRFMNYGKVVELKAVDEGGVVSLYARIQPNASYVWDNQFGRLLYFSMELDTNFAASGKAYLVGLGITDSPASLGTDELKFSQRRNTPQSAFYANVECALAAEEQEPRWLAKLLQRFTANPKEEPMDPKKFAELQEKVDALGTAVDGIRTELKSFTAKHEQQQATAQVQAPAQPTATDAQPDRFTSLEATLVKLAEQVETIGKRFEQAKPGTTVEPSTGPAMAGVL